MAQYLLFWGFKIFWVVIRGIFFQFFYIKFMILGEKEIKEQIEQTKEYKAALEA